MQTVFALLCFVVVIHWLIFPYPSGLLHWHCGNLTIAPVPAKQRWWIWINTSCEFIMNDSITTIKQSTTKPCAYFLGYTVCVLQSTGVLWSIESICVKVMPVKYSNGLGFYSKLSSPLLLISLVKETRYHNWWLRWAPGCRQNHPTHKAITTIGMTHSIFPNISTIYPNIMSCLHSLLGYSTGEFQAL